MKLSLTKNHELSASSLSFQAPTTLVPRLTDPLVNFNSELSFHDVVNGIETFVCIIKPTQVEFSY